MPQNIPAYIFSQQDPPENYDPNRFGPWEPVDIMLIPEIPSKHVSGREYKVVIMYVPTSTPIVNYNWMGYRHVASSRIKAVCCGPSKNNMCPVGARTVAPCAHGTTALFYGCTLSAFPHLFKSTHSTVNIVDPGSKLPAQYNIDIITGNFN